MIIDVNTRAWTSPAQLGADTALALARSQSDRWLRTDASGSALVAELDCVDVALVHGFRSLMLDAHVPAESLAELIAMQPDRLLAIGGVDPLAPDALDEVERIVGLGLSGLTISPSMQGVHPTHSAAMRLYETCETRQLPVFISRPRIELPRSIFEFDRPGNFDEVARSFPGLRLVIGGLGTPWVQETIALLAKHEHIYADLSALTTNPWALWNALLSAKANDVMDRLLFASGWPCRTPAEAIETLYSLNTFSQGSQLPSIPRTAIRSIVERDTLALLGMTRTPSNATADTDASRFRGIDSTAEIDAENSSA